MRSPTAKLFVTPKARTDDLLSSDSRAKILQLSLPKSMIIPILEPARLESKLPNSGNSKIKNDLEQDRVSSLIQVIAREKKKKKLLRNSRRLFQSKLRNLGMI